jgi:hypothetical protein
LKLGPLTRDGVWWDDDIQFNALLGKFTTGELKEETNVNKKYFATVVFGSISYITAALASSMYCI